MAQLRNSAADARGTTSYRDIPKEMISVGYSESPPRSSTPSDALKMLIPFGMDERCGIALGKYRQLAAERAMLTKVDFVEKSMEMWDQGRSGDDKVAGQFRQRLEQVFNVHAQNHKGGESLLPLHRFSITLALIYSVSLHTSSPRKALKSWLSWCFMLYDTDSDGALTREELNSLLRTLDLLSAFLLPYSELTFLIREETHNELQREHLSTSEFAKIAADDSSLHILFQTLLSHLAHGEPQHQTSYAPIQSPSLPLFLDLARKPKPAKEEKLKDKENKVTDSPKSPEPVPSPSPSPSPAPSPAPSPSLAGQSPAAEIFSNQVGGHKGKQSMLKDGETICKPLNENEYKFYEMLSQHPELIPPAFYPKYFGTRTVERGPEDSDAPTQYIILEDLTRKMTKPCVCDLKMGANSRGYDLSAGLKKKIKQTYIHHITTSSSLGFRIVGLRVYHVANDSFTSKDMLWGTKIKDKSMKDALKLYLHNGQQLRYDALVKMLVKLKEILEWITHQSHFLFTSSSILLMYDGSVESAAKENLADVRMIDFAHCFTMNPRDPDHDRIKKSYYSGLTNLIRILEEIKAEVSTPTVVLYEYQRRQLLTGDWAATSLLPPWTDEAGNKVPGRDHVELAYGWKWADAWEIEKTDEDDDGWKYSSAGLIAIGPSEWTKTQTGAALARRRCWRRRRQLVQEHQ